MRHFDNLFEQRDYPAGETHVFLKQVPATADKQVILADVRDFNGLCTVVTADRIVKRQEGTCKWFIPYFPFARDDRRDNCRHGFELGLAMGS